MSALFSVDVDSLPFWSRPSRAPCRRRRWTKPGKRWRTPWQRWNRHGWDVAEAVITL